MCIVARQRRLSSAAFQFYCFIPETYPRPMVQEIKEGCSSGVLSLLVSEMKYRLCGRKTLVTNTSVLGRRSLFSLAKVACKSFSIFFFPFFCVFSFVGLLFKFYLKIMNKVKVNYIRDKIIKRMQYICRQNVIPGCVSVSLRKEQFDAWGKGFDERKKPGPDG